MEAAARAAARAAGSGFRRFSSDSAAALTASFTAARGSGARPSRVSDPAVSSLGMGALASQLERSTRVNQSENSAAASTPSYKRQVNPSYSQFPLVGASFARSSDASVCGRRHFSSLPGDDSAASQVLGPKEPIFEYKKEVINPTFHEAKYFAQNIMNPMMKFPNDEVRLLADDVGSFYTPAERGKPLFNSFKQTLCDVHRSGRAFANPIKMSDFFITESYHEYRMKDENLIKEPMYKFVIKDGTPMCNFSYRMVKENYGHGSDALREFIGFTCDLEDAPLAPDLEGSLGCMKVSSFPKGYLTYVDPVFMRLEDRSEAYLDVYDELDCNEDLNVKNTTGTARSLLHDIPWQRMVGKHDLLRRWYDFMGEGYYNSGSWSLLAYLRHVNRHPVLYFDTRFGEYSKAELQRLLQVTFPFVLPRLYRNMFTHGLLKALGAHRFFRLH